MDEARRTEQRDDYNAELGILEAEEDEAILAVDVWGDITVDTILDSALCRHVMPRECAHGYQVQDSSHSRRGLGFIVGNGERVPNEGQFVLNPEAGTGQESPRAVACTFQVADLTKPLMSVFQLCEQGFQCVFKDTHAIVIDPAGETVCRF